MAEAAIATALPPRLNLDRLWIAPPLLVLAVLFFYPLGLIVRASLGEEAPSLATFEQVLRSSQFLDGLYRTIVIAISSTACAFASRASFSIDSVQRRCGSCG